MASYGTSVRNNLLVQRDLLDIFNDIKRSAELQALVAKFRSIPDEAERRAYKAQWFPYFNDGEYKNNIRSDANLIKTKRNYSAKLFCII